MVRHTNFDAEKTLGKSGLNSVEFSTQTRYNFINLIYTNSRIN